MSVHLSSLPKDLWIGVATPQIGKKRFDRIFALYKEKLNLESFS